MQLFHISPAEDLAVLEPRVPEYRLPGESVDAVVCAAPSWWECAMLYPTRKGLPDILWLYEIESEDVEAFTQAQGFAWAKVEWRTNAPVRVRRLGRIRLEDYDVRRAFSRPCGNCGRPWRYCDDGALCGMFGPPSQDAAID